MINANNYKSNIITQILIDNRQAGCTLELFKTINENNIRNK